MLKISSFVFFFFAATACYQLAIVLQSIIVSKYSALLADDENLPYFFVHLLCLEHEETAFHVFFREKSVIFKRKYK